jgi:hypothetical protein
MKNIATSRPTNKQQDTLLFILRQQNVNIRRRNLKLKCFLHKSDTQLRAKTLQTRK